MVNCNTLPYGWVCPKCGRVYAPSIPMCFTCGGDTNITYKTTCEGTGQPYSTTTASTDPKKYKDVFYGGGK